MPLIAAPTILQLFTFYQRTRLARAALNLDIRTMKAEDIKTNHYSYYTFIPGALSHSLKSISSMASFSSKYNVKDVQKSSKVEAGDDRNEDEEEHVVQIAVEGNMDLGLPEKTHSFHAKQYAEKPKPNQKSTAQMTARSTTLATIPIPEGKEQDGNSQAGMLFRFISLFTSSAFTLILQIAFILPFFIVAMIRIGLHPYGFKRCRGCSFTYEDYIYFLITCAIIATCLIVTVYKLRDLPDPFGVIAQGKNVLLALLFPFIFGVVDAALRQSSQKSNFQFGLLISLSMALIFHVQVTWPLFQAIWNLEKSTKKRGSKITKGTVAVLDIDNTVEPEEIQSTKPKSTKSVLHKAKSSRRSVISTKDGFARVFENQILFEAFELHITAEFGVEVSYLCIIYIMISILHISLVESSILVGNKEMERSIS